MHKDRALPNERLPRTIRPDGGCGRARLSRRIAVCCASGVSGDFQNATSARSNSILIPCRWSDITAGTGQSSTHLMAFWSAVRGGLGPLYGANAAGVSAQPPPRAVPSSALLTITGFWIQ